MTSKTTQADPCRGVCSPTADPNRSVQSQLPKPKPFERFLKKPNLMKRCRWSIFMFLNKRRYNRVTLVKPERSECRTEPKECRSPNTEWDREKHSSVDQEAYAMPSAKCSGDAGDESTLTTVIKSFSSDTKDKIKNNRLFLYSFTS